MAERNGSILFSNARLAFPDFLAEGALLVEGDRIAAIWINEAPSSLTGGVRTVDCQGQLLAPGLIDIHNHGGKTHDFVGANAEGNPWYPERGIFSDVRPTSRPGAPGVEGENRELIGDTGDAMAAEGRVAAAPGVPGTSLDALIRVCLLSTVSDL